MSRMFAWSGGALFVMALAWCGWWYVVSLASAAPGGGWSALAADAALVTAFALHHSVFARPAIKAQVARVVSPALERSVYVWVASVLLILVCVWWRHIGGTVYDASAWRVPLHLVLQLFGLWLIARSAAAVDPLALAGIRAQATNSALQTAGPYGWVRHPLYLGWIVALFGAAGMTRDRLAFAAMTTFYLVIAVPWEERSLVKTFGDEYRRYQRRVRWRIVPYVY